MTDIVERLRDAAGVPRGEHPALLLEAADEIVRLRAAVELWQNRVTKKEEEVDRLRAERDALRQKCSRLRKALRQLNKAHVSLWKVLNIHVERWATEARKP